MSLNIEVNDEIYTITLNRPKTHNAFDDILLTDLCNAIFDANNNDNIRIVVLKGSGSIFCAGADLNWLGRIACFDDHENLQDARILANTLYAIYNCPKVTICVVQGGAYGGGAGLIAACDIGIASAQTKFCFSEVKLGLIPAVISPYIIKAIGTRAALALFLTASTFDATEALKLNLINYCVEHEDLDNFTQTIIHKIKNNGTNALLAAKNLVKTVENKNIDMELVNETATLIANIRKNPEAQMRIAAFLNKSNNDKKNV